MNLDDVNQKNNVQDTENVIDATDITRNVQQLEFSKNYQTNAMHTDCTKNSNCQRCLPTKNCENPNNGKCCPTNCKKKQTVIEKYVLSISLKIITKISLCFEISKPFFFSELQTNHVSQTHAKNYSV